MSEHFGFHGPMWGDDFGWFPESLLSLLGTLLLIALCIALIWALLRWIVPRLWPRIQPMFVVPPAQLSPMEILRRRYAEGTIDTDTFEMMRERLEASYPRQERQQFL